MASEDIGPANPTLILMVDSMLSVDIPRLDHANQMAVVQAIEILAKSPKDRLFDWVCCSWPSVHSQSPPSGVTHPYEDVHQNLRYHLSALETHLQEKEFDYACGVAGQLHFLAEQNPKHKIAKADWTKLKKQFRGPPVFTHLAGLACQIWLPILTAAVETTKSQMTCNLVCNLYHIACTRSGRFQFRGKDGFNLFIVHAIWAICHPSEVERTWYTQIDYSGYLTDEQRVEQIARHRRIGGQVTRVSINGDVEDQEKILPIPDHALDKHTAEGTKRGRGMAHFILIGAKLNNTLPERQAEQLKWLNKCVERFKGEGVLDADFEIPHNYFD